MELLFWLAPVFLAIGILICALSLVFLIWAVLVGLYVLDPDRYSSDSDSDKNNLKRVKKSLVIGLILFFVFTGTTPLMNPMGIYKDVLIYKGINSTLVDKTINTAEKALNVFNNRLDEELNKKSDNQTKE